MKKELKKALKIVEKFNKGENLTLEEIKILAYTDIRMLDTEEWSSVSSILIFWKNMGKSGLNMMKTSLTIHIDMDMY